jgi:hypothetical protein
MKIISKRQVEHVVTHSLVFPRPYEGASFAFACDADGRVDVGALALAAVENYRRCVAGDPGHVTGPGVVETRESTYVHPAVGECVCGGHVELAGFTNTCYDCQRDYNHGGMQLAPREQWGEETGEFLADILGVDGASAGDLLEGE